MCGGSVLGMLERAGGGGPGVGGLSLNGGQMAYTTLPVLDPYDTTIHNND